MKYNFTNSCVLVRVNTSKKSVPKSVTKILILFHKIINGILLFKPKKIHQLSFPWRKSMPVFCNHSYIEGSLQEYFVGRQAFRLIKSEKQTLPNSIVTNQDLIMNKLSMSDSLTIKEYYLNSKFDENLARWVSSLSSPRKIKGDGGSLGDIFFKGVATTILLMFINVFGLIAQNSVDLSLKKTIDKALPALNEIIKYKLVLKNSGPSAANAIVVQDNFPVGGAILNSHSGGSNFSYSSTTGVGTWSIPTLAAGDSLSLDINASVIQQGVFFNTAEVISIGAGQIDLDSTPNNSKLQEDDISSVCFSVPLQWYPGEEYQVSVPAPYRYGSTIKWFNGTTEIKANNTVAVVNADSSLTIKAPGSFTFTTSVSNCPAQGCCAVQVIEGPYGSIGGFIWKDTNNNGLQDIGEVGAGNVIIELYSSDASGIPFGSPVGKDTTNASGIYSFNKLQKGDYFVKILSNTLPVTYSISSKVNAGDDTKDSDFNPTSGFSPKISIDPLLTNLKDNLNIGGAIYTDIYIGLGMYVKDTVKQTNGSYNITYKAIIKNFSSLNLSNVQMCDTISTTFLSPAIAKLAVKPVVSSGSLLKVDTSFNGTTKTCMLLDNSQLAPNRVDTLTWVINLVLNGNKGPFRNNITATAKTPSGLVLSDMSNDGISPEPIGSIPTVVNFNVLPEALIGISKSASEPKLVPGTINTYDVVFTFKVKNYGKVAFTGVQIQDNLNTAFGDSTKIDSLQIIADDGLRVNSGYTGRGTTINLLVDSLSTLPANTERNVILFTRLTRTSAKSAFENQALVIGKYPTNKQIDDLSTNGNDPDFTVGGDSQKNNDGDPRNNSIATPVKLGETGITTTFGIAKAATLGIVKNSDGSYNLIYKVVIKNYGTRPLTAIQLSDSLSKVFADSATFVLVGKAVLGRNSQLKIDSTFNGTTKTTMLIAESSSLAAGASDTLTFKLRLLSTKQKTVTYSNTITGTAKDNTLILKDISQTGLNPNPDTDNNPGNNSEPTVITIKGKTSTDTTKYLPIPQGFSPNDDGKNDIFAVKGINGVAGVKAEIFIYNRWGHLVYQNTDFAKVQGWNSESNNGILLGEKGIGVPDGTYFIHLKAVGFWNNKPQIKFITIAR